MNNIDELRKIIADAPEGATHVDVTMPEYLYFDGNAQEWLYQEANVENDTVEFSWVNSGTDGDVSKLSDITTIIEQADKIAVLEANQVNYIIRTVNSALSKLFMPKLSKAKCEYFKAGVRAMAYAVEAEAKQEDKS
ncbi:hypothetical protein JLT2_68 [Paraglaciecola Antarctic JLT virus 2]|nr:hypothetical protein JLT2_68 [Paraglaciecola Antarctic JLT virus 2]